MPRMIRKNIVPGGALLLLLAGLIYAFWPKPIPVWVGAVERGSMLVTIEDEGETRIKEVYTISSPLSGRVARFEGHVGDSVTAGKTVVATIRPTEPTFHDSRTLSELQSAAKAAEAERDLARAHVTSTEAVSDFAIAEYERVNQLSARGTLSRSALDKARMEVRTKAAELREARAALRVREFQVQTAQAALLDPTSSQRARDGDLCCFEVRAPVSGTILRVFRESEAVVRAGEPLVEIGNPTELEIVVDLLSNDAVLVSPGDAVLIDGWGGERSLRGQVRRIEPFGFTKVSALGIEEQRVNVIVDLTDPPKTWNRLGHGYRVVARIVRWRGKNVLKVPLSALFRTGDAWTLFRIEDGRARRVIVRVGHMNDRSVEVVSGLAAGNTVLLHPGDRVEDGTRVVARASR